MSNDSKPTRIEITEGQIQANHGYVPYPGRIELVCVDLGRKYAAAGPCTMGSEGTPSIMVLADEETIGVDRETEAPTDIAFPDFKGWEIVHHYVSRYTLYAYLRRPEVA